jgi:hypothetical protein
MMPSGICCLYERVQSRVNHSKKKQSQGSDPDCQKRSSTTTIAYALKGCSKHDDSLLLNIFGLYQRQLHWHELN